MTDQEKDSNLTELTKYLKANLLLQLRSLSDDEKDKVKPEFLLYRAGFSRSEIAEILGKKYETVKKTLQLLKTEKVEKTDSKEVSDEREDNKQ